MSETIEASKMASEKMNEIADNMILARNVFVGTLAMYATYSLTRKFVFRPLAQTYRFLSNQTKDLQCSLHEKYGSGIAIIMNSTTGFGPIYAKYLRKMRFKILILVDSDRQALSQQKEDLLQKRRDSIEIEEVHTIAFDFCESDPSKIASGRDITLQIRTIVERSNKAVSIIVNNMSISMYNSEK
jgi:hypothetical protein